MKAFIHYVASHTGSCRQAKKALATATKYGWDAELRKGITPDTLNEDDFPFADLPGGRLQAFFNINKPQVYPYKKSNLFNILSFAKCVVEHDEPMAFLEHDAICKMEFALFDFAEYCFLAFQSALQGHKDLQKLYGNYISPKPYFGINEFPQDYPVRYDHDTIYKGAIQSPGTIAFALSPVGAKKLLYAAEKHGLEQSDYIINSYNLRMQYLHPSPVGHQKNNLKLSRGWK